jgi:hypothetical protein
VLPGQCRHDGAVGPVRLGPGDLTAEHRDLMTENHDLRILGRMAELSSTSQPKIRIMMR